MYMLTFNPRHLAILVLLALAIPALAQDKKPSTPANGNAASTTPSLSSLLKSGPKPYKDVITDKAIAKKACLRFTK